MLFLNRVSKSAEIVGMKTVFSFSLVALCCLMLCTPPLVAQDGSAEPAPVPGSAEPAPVPGSYREISLGMTLEAVQEALTADTLFGYRGERDISLLPTRNRTLIETAGASFIRRSWFQFHNEILYTMTFTLDSSRVDYYSIYSSLVSKYGEPDTLDPAKATWSDDLVILTLERPLTLRYIDVKIFNELVDQSGTSQAASDFLRESFISEF